MPRSSPSTDSQRKLRVCFVCPYAYPLFSPEAPGKFGGAEVYAWLFARGLAKMPRFDVSFAVFDHGQPPEERFEGVRVFALPPLESPADRLAAEVRGHVERSPKFPWIVLRHWQTRLLWRLPRLAAYRAVEPLRRCSYRRTFRNPPLWRSLLRADADVYCAFGAHHLTAETVAFCRRHGRTSVLLVQSDYDLLPQYFRGSLQRNMYGETGHACHYGLARADYVVAQTEPQQALLRERFGRRSTLIRQPIELPVSPGEETDPPERKQYVLWIGKSDGYKRPELCLELARRCAEIPFLMIMNRAEEDVHRAILADLPENVRSIERVKFAEIERYFRRAAVLVNTSAYEGFPHAFLQAGKCGAPVVSLSVDPDGFLERHRCGIAAHDDLDAMAAAVRRIWQGGAAAAEMTDNIGRYVRELHELSGRAGELALLLETIAAPGLAGDSQARARLA